MAQQPQQSKSQGNSQSKSVAVPPAPQPSTEVAKTTGSQVEMKTMPGVTAENFTTFTREQLTAGFGNTSNAIRGLAALGLKPGPISKHLEIRYQHARNVLKRPLKRQIAEDRAKQTNAGAPGSAASTK